MLDVISLRQPSLPAVVHEWHCDRESAKCEPSFNMLLVSMFSSVLRCVSILIPINIEVVPPLPNRLVKRLGSSLLPGAFAVAGVFGL